MMQLTPRKLAAIKALAEDERGDPATRAIAKAKLDEAMRAEAPYRHHKANPPNPRMAKRPDFEKFRFMDLGQWKDTTNGNHSIVITDRFGQGCRVIVFRHKKTRTFGWMWFYVGEDGPAAFGNGKFDTIREAQDEAWEWLTS